MAELSYTDIGGINRRIVLDGSTVIGRAPSLGLGEERARFHSIDEVTSYISHEWSSRSRDGVLVEQVVDAYVKRSLDVEFVADISRVHAMVRQVGGVWEILDTFSKGGTFVNGSRLPHFVGRVLKHNDSIELCGGNQKYGFVFKDRASIEDKLYAYVVSNPQGDDASRNVVANRFCQELKQRGFDFFVSQDSVLGAELDLNLAIAAERVPVDGYFVFAYMGHCSRGAKFSMKDEPYSASRLFEAGHNIRGKQIYLLDCCHSGLFLGQNVPPNSAVISSTEEVGKSERTILLYNFIKLLGKSSDNVVLDDSFVEKLRLQGFEASKYNQSPAHKIQVSRAVIHSRK